MANLAAALKEEIRRLARREIKAETGAYKAGCCTIPAAISPA